MDIQEEEDRLFWCACGLGDVQTVKQFLKEGRVDPSVDHNYAIRSASEHGRTEIVRLLLEDNRVNPADLDNEAIQEACYYGHTETVRLLLEDGRADPSDANNSSTIKQASMRGHINVVKLLLTDGRADPSVTNNMAIRWAIDNNNVELFKLLLADNRVSLSDSVRNHILEYGNIKIIKAILTDHRINIQEKGSIRIDDLEFICFDNALVRVKNNDVNTLSVIGVIGIEDKYIQWQYRIGGEKWSQARNSVEN